jgi:hypothetical protein
MVKTSNHEIFFLISYKFLRPCLESFEKDPVIYLEKRKMFAFLVVKRQIPENNFWKTVTLSEIN